MVFQKTKGRSVFTQPVGMPDLSGFKQAARSYQQLGSLITEFGTEIRKRDYNDAIRQAEVDGKSAGTKYVKDENGEWKLAPLVNLDYSKSVQHLPKADQEGVLKAYREAAVGAYTARAINDINFAAGQSYGNNRNNPGGIRSEMNGYIQGLKEQVPDEVFVQLAPKVEAAFLASENKAFAQQQIDADAAAVADFTTKFNSNTKELGNMYSVGPVDDDDTSVEGFEMRISEITEEDEQTLQHLQTLGMNATEVDELRASRVNHITQRVGESFIEKTWLTSDGDLEQTLLAVEDIVNQARQDTDVDADTLRSTLTSKATRLETLDKARKAEAAEERENIFQNYNYRVYVKNEDISADLANPNSDIYKLEATQIGSLLSVSDAKREEFINDEYNKNVSLIKNWEQFMGTPFEKDLPENFNNIFKMWKNGVLDFEKFAEARSFYVSYFDKKFLEPNILKAEVQLVRELGKGSNYAISPDYFRAIAPDLVARKVIGEGRKYTDLAAYETAIGSYAKEYHKQIKKINEGRRELSHAQAGIPVSESGMEKINNYTSNYKAILPPDQNGQVKVAELDFLTDDEVLFQASADAADRFANESNGLLLPEAKRIFESARSSEELADKSVRIMGQIITGMSSVSGESQQVEMNHFFDMNNFSEEDRHFFTLSSKIGVANAIKAYEGKRDIGYNKGVEKLFPNRPEGKKLDDAVDEKFDEVFRDALTGHDWWKLLNPKISQTRQAQLREFAMSAGLDATDLSNAIIRDPVVRDGLKGIWLRRWQESMGEGSPVEIMRSALQTIGKRFGYEEDERTGQIYLVERPIIHYAQATVPGRRLSDGTIIPNVQITNRMIAEDVVKKFLAPQEGGALRNPEVDEAVRRVLDDQNLNKSDISFHANMGFGDQQTYTVVVTDHNGNPHVLSRNYNYNFGTSVQNEYYQKVMDDIQTSKVKDFWSAYGLFDLSVIQGAFENYHMTGSDMSLHPLIKSLNELRLSTSPGASPEFLKSLGEPLKPEEIQDFMRLWNNIIAWGKL